MLEAKKIMEVAVNTLEEKKGANIKVLDISKISLIANYFIIATGGSRVLLQSLARYVEEDLDELGVKPIRVEGFPEAEWILMDYDDVIIHLFTPDKRDYYQLERLWGDAKILEMEN